MRKYNTKHSTYIEVSLSEILEMFDSGNRKMIQMYHDTGNLFYGVTRIGKIQNELFLSDKVIFIEVKPEKLDLRRKIDLNVYVFDEFGFNGITDSDVRLFGANPALYTTLDEYNNTKAIKRFLKRVKGGLK
ncbi:MAG: hypothetical protein ACRCXX_11635 [Cetobacterium sp.]|uniref:hypothetical protein n=1 Tax=Cetobacterium sp. TaxID=2071632 RepID=UPI003F39E3D0